MKTVAQLAEAIWAARQAGRTLDADATVGSPDLATAYAIQRALLGLRLAAGERVVGWKLGYTSEVMRRQMGIARPNIGPLTDRMLQNSGDAVHERLVQPRVEPEIGLRLQTALDARNAPVDRHTVAAAVEGAYACLEVVHSTWIGYRFNLEQNTADNSSAGQVVGWFYDPEREEGDNFIDFNLYRLDGEDGGERRRAFINGHERSVLLDFNVDGIIYDKI